MIRGGLLLLLLLSTSVARAQPVRGSAALARARSALEGCTPLEPLPDEWIDEDAWEEQLDLEQRAGGVVLSYASRGNGVESEGGGWDLWVGPDCEQVFGEWSYQDGVLAHAMALRRTEGAPLAAEVAVVGERADPSRPEHALGLFTTELVHPWWCVDDAGLCGELSDGIRVCVPEAPPSPWVPGAPMGSPALFLPETTEESVTSGRATVMREAPTQVGTIGRYERWQSELGGRNGGVLVAAYDAAQDRHRWLFASRGCVNGTTIRWLGEGEGLAIGEARSRHPRYRSALFAIAIERGTAHRIDIEDAWVGDEWESLGDFGASEDELVEDGVPSEATQRFFAPRVEDGFLVVRLADRSERRVALTDLATRVASAPIVEDGDDALTDDEARSAADLVALLNADRELEPGAATSDGNDERQYFFVGFCVGFALLFGARRLFRART